MSQIVEEEGASRKGGYWYVLVRHAQIVVLSAQSMDVPVNQGVMLLLLPRFLAARLGGRVDPHLGRHSAEVTDANALALPLFASPRASHLRPLRVVGNFGAKVANSVHRDRVRQKQKFWHLGRA